MGGPMNVYEEAQYPVLRDETRFLQMAAARDLPVLGICLGAQMIAKAAGAAVTKNHVEEVGWRTVNLTGEGLADRLFRGLPRALPVFQWHGDTSDPGGRRAAHGRTDCHHQAFRFRRSYGLQPPRSRPPLIAEWFAREAGEILRRCTTRPRGHRHVRTLFRISLIARHPL
jgi:GMP synthase-like glutamine amidotransferase